ncbi:Uncharacterized protein DAT39_001595 [Clarias magur]|uniref:Uncharacterized protein n=1 Tax=Clarias magur TaxID=1594786 RepID=A0A8J4UWR2_CLAMG|nr:Uncharacterized protein DAT39_001595 [Clarias magur]
MRALHQGIQIRVSLQPSATAVNVIRSDSLLSIPQLIVRGCNLIWAQCQLPLETCVQYV